jgi:hypothetical protein
MPSNRFLSTFFLALGVVAAAGCSSDDRPTLGSDSDELTQAQCTYFAEGDKVQICHRTGSARNPYNVIRTNIASCGGHIGHAGDYITSTNPSDPEYDPTCNGQGCFPEGAPYDGSVDCCAGLSAPVGGVCTDIDECATNNGGCGADDTCADAELPGDAPTCTPIDDCADDPAAAVAVATSGDLAAPAGSEYRRPQGAVASATSECPDWSCGVGQGAAGGAIDDDLSTMWNNGTWDQGQTIALTIQFSAPASFHGVHLIAEALPVDDETYTVTATRPDGSQFAIGTRTATIDAVPARVGVDVGFSASAYTDVASIEIRVSALPFEGPPLSSWIAIREVQLIGAAGCLGD